MSRITLLPAAGLMLGSSSLLAQGTSRHHRPSRDGMSERCRAMMADMKALDDRLDEKLAAVNTAKGPDRVEAMAAFLNELVSQRKTTHEKMAGMSPMTGCPMMPH